MKADDGRRLKFSIVVPCWNDGEALTALLPSLFNYKNIHEVIVVDASADRACAEIAKAGGAIYLHLAKPSRGEQMNLGAAKATGDVLVFNHADTELNAAHLSALEQAMSDVTMVGGAFFRVFDRRHPHLDWLGKIARIHNRWGSTIFGDQTFFVRRETFRALGGFAPIPLMEDIEFSRRLRAAGRVVIIDPPVRSSGRRHARRGPWRTSLLNVLLLALYKIGVSPRTLHRWYYPERSIEKSANKLPPKLARVE